MPPIEFRDCGPQPMPPLTPTDTDIAGFMLDLRLWGWGCSDKLTRLWLWAEPKENAR